MEQTYRTPRWSMVLSHHPPSQYERTFKLFGARICARCAGVVAGLPVGSVATQMLPSILLSSNGGVLLVALAALALGVEIFVRNEVGQRRSGNGERVAFGVVMGATLVIAFHSTAMIFLGLVVAVVVGQFYAALRMRKLGVLDRFMEDYMEGAVIEHDRALHAGGIFTRSCNCESKRH